MNEIKTNDVEHQNKLNQPRYVLDWNQYFMSIAYVSSLRSKDPSRQVGCCIVDNDKHIISTGYNGFPNNCPDEYFPWEKNTEKYSDSKYAYVVHAELNAIIQAKRDLTNCILYVTTMPCNECMKAIIQSGIKTIYYGEEYKNDEDYNKIIKKMSEYASVNLIHLSYDKKIEIYI